LALEMQRAVKLPVKSCGLAGSQLSQEVEGAIPVTLAGKEKIVRKELPEGTELLVLQVNSVPASLASWMPAPSGVLLGVASRWPGFLKMGRTILAAAGLHPESVLFRDARKANWQRGLKETAAVVCDSATASELPKTVRVVQFPLVSESSLAELRRYEEFIRNPLVASV
jgi:hypothetical protein